MIYWCLRYIAKNHTLLTQKVDRKVTSKNVGKCLVFRVFIESDSWLQPHQILVQYTVYKIGSIMAIFVFSWLVFQWHPSWNELILKWSAVDDFLMVNFWNVYQCQFAILQIIAHRDVGSGANLNPNLYFTKNPVEEKVWVVF